MLDKNAILSAQDIKTETVAVPEWNGSVGVRTLSATDLLSFWDSCRDAAGELVRDRVQPALLARTLVGDDGARIFNDEDIGALMAKSAGAVAKLFEAAQRLNGLGGAAEDATKNG